MRQQAVAAASSLPSAEQTDLAAHGRGSCQSDRLHTALSILSQAFDRLITPLGGWGLIWEGGLSTGKHTDE